MNSVMSEYALWFFVLLEESYKIKSMEMYNSSVVASVPYMENKDRKKLFKDLETSSRDIIDLGNNEDYSGLDALKKELHG